MSFYHHIHPLTGYHSANRTILGELGSSIHVAKRPLLTFPRWARTSKSKHMPSSCYVATVFRKRYPGRKRPAYHLPSHVDFFVTSCVFYGDLYPNRECFDETISEKIKQLLIVRRIFAHGPSKDYFQHRNCIGFVRTGNHDYAGCVVVMSNESPDLGCVPTAFHAEMMYAYPFEKKHDFSDRSHERGLGSFQIRLHRATNLTLCVSFSRVEKVSCFAASLTLHAVFRRIATDGGIFIAHATQSRCGSETQLRSIWMSRYMSDMYPRRLADGVDG